jgi:hypothetical protein
MSQTTGKPSKSPRCTCGHTKVRHTPRLSPMTGTHHESPCSATHCFCLQFVGAALADRRAAGEGQG